MRILSTLLVVLLLSGCAEDSLVGPEEDNINFRQESVIAPFSDMGTPFMMAGPWQNIALNKTVTLEGDFFNSKPRGGKVAKASSLVDGEFLDAETAWDAGSVWWIMDDEKNPQQIIIDLGGTYRLQGITAQFSNNYYLIEYARQTKNGFEWAELGSIDKRGSENVILKPYEVLLRAAVETHELRITGILSVEKPDNRFAFSELQAFVEMTQVDLRINPRTIDLESNGQWITAIIDFPDVVDTDKARFILNKCVINKCDGGQRRQKLLPDSVRWAGNRLILKINRDPSNPYSFTYGLKPGLQYQIEISIEIENQTYYGSDTIRTT